MNLHAQLDDAWHLLGRPSLARVLHVPEKREHPAHRAGYCWRKQRACSACRRRDALTFVWFCLITGPTKTSSWNQFDDADKFSSIRQIWRWHGHAGNWWQEAVHFYSWRPSILLLNSRGERIFAAAKINIDDIANPISTQSSLFLLYFHGFHLFIS